MRNLITAATLLLAANGVAAAGFSPWTDAAIATEVIEIQDVSVASVGFAPWRDRNVVADIGAAGISADVALTKAELNVFRPWS